MGPKKQIEYKARILFLHGYTQNASAFYAKTLALRKRLQSLKYKAVYLNAPVNLTPAQLPTSDPLSKFGSSEDSSNYRGWWIKENDDTYNIDEAIASVKNYLDHAKIIPGSPEDEKAYAISEEDAKLPVVGLIGFSQGAALGGALVHTFEELFGTTLQFAVLYSGFKIDTKIMPHYKKLYTSDNGKSTSTRLLHVVGELDTVVGDDRSYTFYDISKENSDLLKHPGGHFVPNSKLIIDQVVGWIQNEKVEAKKDEKSDLDDIMAMLDKIGGM